MVVQLFIARPRERDYLSWVQKDGAPIRDTSRTVQRLRFAILSRIDALLDDGEAVTAWCS